MTRIALTGATGFIGSRLLTRLQGTDADVRVLVRPGAELSDSQCRVWGLSPSEAKDREALQGVDALIHLGAFVPPDLEAPQYLRSCLEVNAVGTLDLLEAAVGAGVQRIVFFSGGNCYHPRYSNATESDQLYPSGRAAYYLTSKLCGEIVADHFGVLERATVTILRPSAVYGAGMRAGLVPFLANALYRGEEVIVSDARQHRDLVYVDDVVAATLAVLEKRPVGAFNLGSGETITKLAIAETLADYLGRGRDLISVSDHVTSGSSGHAALSITRARGELGYDPRSIADGLREYVRWFVWQQSAS